MRVQEIVNFKRIIWERGGKELKLNHWSWNSTVLKNGWFNTEIKELFDTFEVIIL